MKRITATGIALAILSTGAFCAAARAQAPGASLMPADKGASVAKHFDPLGKPPSKFTLELRNGFKAELPLADRRDFDEAKRGFIAEPPYTKIMADAGHVAWDMGSYGWLLTGKDFETIICTKQCPLKVNTQNPAVMGATLAAAEATR